MNSPRYSRVLMLSTAYYTINIFIQLLGSRLRFCDIYYQTISISFLYLINAMRLFFCVHSNEDNIENVVMNFILF